MSTESGQLWRGRIVALLALGGVATVTGLIMTGPHYEVAVLTLDNRAEGPYQIQTPSPGSGALLLRVQVDGAWQVYRYDVARTELVPQESGPWGSELFVALAPPWQWTHDSGDDPVYIADGKLKIDPPTPGPDATTVALKGDFALSFSVNRSSGKCAVLTVDTGDLNRKPVFGSPQAGRYSGVHYIELFRFPHMVPIRAAVHIPFTTVRGYPEIQWSADGRYFVMMAPGRRTLCVVDTEPPADSPE